MNNENNLWEEFLEKWSPEKVNDMTLEEYTKVGDTDTFTAWLESKLESLGSIWGGSSFKFGIFNRKDTSKKTNDSMRHYVDDYAWHPKYGKDPDIAFKKIKGHILEVIRASQNGDLSTIDSVDLGDAYKWKIAFLYQDRDAITIVPVYSPRALRYLCNAPTSTACSEMHKMLSEEYNTGASDIFTYSKELWNKWDDERNGKNVDFAGIIKNLMDEIEEQGYPYSSLKFGDIKSSYVWLLDHENAVSGISAHYEIRQVSKNVQVELHFEGEPEEKSMRTSQFTTLPEGLTWFKWSNAKSIKVAKSISVESKTLIDDLLSAINNIMELGPMVKDILNKSDTPPLAIQPAGALNTILYGPPGTGKTYITRKKAVEIAGVEIDLNDRDAVKKAYQEMLDAGQIVFTTFHQSYSYEDFVEGIRPEYDDEIKMVSYPVRDGVFKTLVNNSKKVRSRSSDKLPDWNSVNYYKISLGGKTRPEIHEWCIQNNYMTLGYGGDEDLSELLKHKTWSTFRDKFTEKYPKLKEESKYHIQAQFIFNKMKIGDVVVASLGNKIIDAIGIVEGDYEFDDQKEVSFSHFRKVRWIASNLNLQPDRFFNKRISQQSVYEFYGVDVKRNAFQEYFETKETFGNKVPHILIIDEINRGNISKIFGELITLIEDSKRIDGDDPQSVILPYSGDEFSVPSNLYIIGTMNTADRSIALMDTALRRRFEFEEMMPKPELDLINKNIDGINCQQLLKTINERIEYLYDRDHTIGHAYFMGVDSKEKLDSVMRNKVIPLLQEYFYDDWEKIQLVLGDHFKQHGESSEPSSYDDDLNSKRFIQSQKELGKTIFGVNSLDSIEEYQVSYRVNPSDKGFPIEAYQRLTAGE